MDAPVPDNIQPLLTKIVTTFLELIPQELVGIYLHGSLAMDCFNPHTSDIDFLVVTRTRLPIDDKRRIGDALLQLVRAAPPKGIEMSAITLDTLRRFEHPTPFELHFSNEWKDAFANNCIDFAEQRRDYDLAAHFVITRERGATLHGLPITDIFPQVPRHDFLDSILRDVGTSITNVMNGSDDGFCAVPTYAVLNFCRVLAFIDESRIASKREGGQWGLTYLPADHHPIIAAALQEYLHTSSSSPVDATALKAFALFVQKRLRHTSTDF